MLLLYYDYYGQRSIIYHIRGLQKMETNNNDFADDLTGFRTFIDAGGKIELSLKYNSSLFTNSADIKMLVCKFWLLLVERALRTLFRIFAFLERKGLDICTFYKMLHVCQINCGFASNS